mmetsp:Transcript_108746/g.318152  ORF Transcript_108746/g.318152 Transcript_108746/m.318152 type:complete len:289 (+) Transcript_108746:122-988(+)
MLRILACILGVASGINALEKTNNVLRSAPSAAELATDSSARSIVQSDAVRAPEQSLIICNAYANSKPLDVVNVHSQQRLTKGEGLSYKACHDFRTSLQEGDRLEFKAGNVSVGIFRATGVPKTSATLLLIPHRRDLYSMTASFESHAFAQSGSPQVVVVDAYRGKEAGKVKIMDAEDGDKAKESRVEDLRFNSIVALGAGKYQLLLQSEGQKDIAKVALEVKADQANYVVLRTGLQDVRNASASPAFPQELVVYGEERGEQQQQSAAAPLRLPALAAAALAGLAAAAW